MARRGESVHVATTTRRYKDKIYKTHLLRRTYREDGKVKHETLGNISHLPEHVIDLVRCALKGETLVPVGTVFQTERSLPHGHVAAVLGTLRQLGLDRLIASRPSRQRDLVVAMVVARVINPRSKLATARGLDGGSDSLGTVLGLQSVTEDELYAAMDWLLPRQARIEKGLAKRHLRDDGLVLCDVSSTYFEGRTCPLAQFGHNRDGKLGLLQIVFGLLCDAEGRPVAVKVFDGNTGDPSTVPEQVDTLRKRFGLDHLVLVGDRGLLTSARIREDLEPHTGLRWITALRAPAIRRLVERETLQLSLFDQRDLAEIQDPKYPGERLIVCRNPLLAEERTRKRNELLACTERDLQAVAAATERKARPLRGRDQIGLRVGKVLDRYKMAKHFVLTIEDDRFSWARNEAKIAEEASLDGVYVIRTNVAPEKLTAEEAVEAYKNLSRVEAGFRCLKSVDLMIRPINHRLADRVRAHVFLCMLSYYVEWHLKQRLASLLFHDDDPVGAASRRTSIVGRARRSAEADRKASTHLTVDNLPVQSFRDLLHHLATLCKNQVRADLPTPVRFEQHTEATPLQRRAFQLLEVSVDV